MPLPLVEFGPLGRAVPRVGFGCGRVVGRSTLRESSRLLEVALDLGVRYFDVAPSYGMGTAEEVVGAVAGGMKDVVVATKVGVPRGNYSSRGNLLRKFGKPLLDRARFLKSAARTFYAKGPVAPGTRPRYDFTPDAVRRSLDLSLRLLRRDRADIFLAHEPHLDDLGEGLAATFTSLRSEGRIGCFGVGVDVRSTPWAPFGEVWQSGWPGGPVAAGYGTASCVFHGVIRYSEKSRSGETTVPPARLLREAMTAAPGAIFLVSVSRPERLRELLSEVLA
jgi:aryl-alcohol dehydrogenase-like predicted oxidoreductase